jgi:hypothetical protein
VSPIGILDGVEGRGTPAGTAPCGGSAGVDAPGSSTAWTSGTGSLGLVRYQYHPSTPRISTIPTKPVNTQRPDRDSLISWGDHLILCAFRGVRRAFLPGRVSGAAPGGAPAPGDGTPLRERLAADTAPAPRAGPALRVGPPPGVPPLPCDWLPPRIGPAPAAPPFAPEPGVAPGPAGVPERGGLAMGCPRTRRVSRLRDPPRSPRG